ncbi:hypothetical protein [Sigmofec virus UA08Rod_4967]|uniref:Uncharacterized protein n=1 Tax=Sigmofec virus UA08Rod_4967 TaxID=2929413 RepID=A0A976N1G5_9VIRU|nr:hypothetical protein [Sigmofec virus UA08Rod_4967]
MQQHAALRAVSYAEKRPTAAGRLKAKSLEEAQKYIAKVKKYDIINNRKGVTMHDSQHPNIPNNR